MIKNYFKILGIKPTNSIDKIKTAYKKQLLLWHPDRINITRKNYNDADVQTKKINEAFNFIKDNIKYNTEFDKIVSDYEITLNNEEINNIRNRVISSNIEWLEYYPKLQILIVKFKKSSIYLYENLPSNIYHELILSESKGRYFNQRIAFVYIYHKLNYYNEWYKIAEKIYNNQKYID